MVSQVPEVNTRKSRYSYGIICKKDVTGLSNFDHKLDEVSTNNPDGRKTTLRVDWYLRKLSAVVEA